MALVEGFHPLVKLELFAPSIQNAALLESLQQHITHAPIASGKAGFQVAQFRLMPVEINALDAMEHRAQISLLVLDLLLGILRLPLERGERLGHKAGSAAGNTQSLCPLILWHSKVGTDAFLR